MDEKKLGYVEAPITAPPAYADAASSSQAAFRTSFACVTFNHYDLIRFISFPPDVVDAMHSVIVDFWPKGIQRTQPYGEADEVKLRGNPWLEGLWADTEDARRLVRSLLEALYDRGWVLQAAIDHSKKGAAGDAMMFRHQNPPPGPCTWMTIAMDKWDRLTLSELPSADLTAALLEELEPMVSGQKVTENHLEIKFHGTPWLPGGEETVMTPMILMKLLETLEKFGYSLYTSICLNKHGGEHRSDSDVMVVHRQRNWRPGMPIFHR